MTARSISGKEAADIGLANDCAPAAELDDLVASVIGQMLDNSPHVLAAYKVLYRDTEDRTLSAGLAFEAGTIFEIPDTGERLSGFRK